MCPEAAKLILSIKLFIIKLILGGIRLILILVEMALMKPIDLKEKTLDAPLICNTAHLFYVQKNFSSPHFKAYFKYYKTLLY
jgi:hypothetical protein